MQTQKSRYLILASVIIGCLLLNSMSAKCQLVYMPEPVYKVTLTQQQKKSRETLAALRKKDITESAALRLDFSFRTNTSQKANELLAQLKVFGYEASVQKAPAASFLHLVTGKSPATKMSEKSILEWTKVMCDLGYEFDCMFMGWKASIN